MTHYDVVIVGAGLSGIGTACHLQDKCPGKTFVLLEGRDALGGTWDLFRYPGVRSDSDMHTLGYNFKPWRAAKAIADGPSILDYVREAAEKMASSSTSVTATRSSRPSGRRTMRNGGSKPNGVTSVLSSPATCF